MMQPAPPSPPRRSYLKTESASIKWYELRPYPGEEDTDDFGTIIDHIPRFACVISKHQGYLAIHLGALRRHLPLLESLSCTEPVPSRPPRLHGYHVSYQYGTMRHCALPVGSVDSPSPIFRIMADSVAGSAYLMVWCQRAAFHPRISHYIRMTERGQAADGMAGLISKMWGSPSRPGPSHMRNLKLAREKAAARHLFACRIVAAAHHVKDLSAIESSFPSMSLRRTSKASVRHIDAVSSGRKGIPFWGGSRLPILSDAELRLFIRLPDEKDMASVPINVGRMSSHSGGERMDVEGATTIDIERTDDYSAEGPSQDEHGT